MTVIRYDFNGYVDERKARKTIKDLRAIAADDPGCDIEFVINSPGGHVTEGTAIYDELYRMSERGGGCHHITTRVQGMAASMATLIFEAGDFRTGGPLDLLVYHETKMCAEDEFMSHLQARIDALKAWDAEYYRILAKRAKVGIDGIKELCGPYDNELLISEAVAMGLADWVTQ